MALRTREDYLNSLKKLKPNIYKFGKIIEDVTRDPATRRVVESHARALDGAGNWGTVAHYPYYCTNPVPKASTDGLEASATWQVGSDRKRSRCTLHEVDTAGGNNRLLVAEL